MSKEISPWEALDLEATDPEKKKSEKLRLDIKRKFRACFGTEAGIWVLEYLNGKYFNQVVVDENAVNVLAAAGIREGELRLLRYIHHMMQTEK